jgi:ribosomal protein S21
VVGLAKFHAITMLMRCYEFIAEKLLDEFTLDRLTIDPFETALRLSKRSRTKGELSREMYTTCLWANIVAFLADYSVHQVILAYTYYQHYQAKRKRKKAGDTSDDLAPPMLSYLTKSTSLIVSRGFGLFLQLPSVAHGERRSIPGWGTIVGSQFCDGVVTSIFDELQPSVMKVQQL